MTPHLGTFGLMASATALIAATLGPKPPPYASESVPIGLYSVQPAHHLTVTDLVVAFPPEDLAIHLAEGRYLPGGVPLIKRILALPKQIVCRQDLRITSTESK